MARKSTTLEDFRKLYPEHADVSDSELRQALEAEDVDVLDGPSAPPSTPLTPPAPPQKPTGVQYGQIGKDIGKGLLGVGPEMLNIGKALVTGAGPAAKQVATDPVRAMQNIGGGLAMGGAGLLATPRKGREYLESRGIGVPEWARMFENPERLAKVIEPRMGQDYDYRGALGLTGEQPGDELLTGLGSFGAFAPLGPAALPAMATAQDQNIISGTLAPMGIGKAAKMITSPTKTLLKQYINKQVPLSELADNFRAAQGTETLLGDVIKSPAMKRLYENEIVPRRAESAETYQRIIDQTTGKAQEILYEKLGGKDKPITDANQALFDSLNKAFRDVQDVKKSLYDKTDALIAKEGVEVPLNQFQKIAADNAKAISESPPLATDSDFKALHNKLSQIKVEEPQFSPILDSSGKPILKKMLKPEVSDAKMLAAKYSDAYNQSKNSPLMKDRAQANLYKKLADALRKDVRDAIEKQGSPELKDTFELAEGFYKDAFVDFLDKDLWQLKNNEGGAELIARKIIKPSRVNDSVDLIERFQKAMPKDKANDLGYTYLSAAEIDGALDVSKMVQLYKGLGPRQRKAVFPDNNIRGALDDLSRLKNMNSEAFSYMANPKTGARNLNLLSKIGDSFSSALKGGGTLGSMGYKYGGEFGAILGAFAGMGAGKLFSGKTYKYLEKQMRDPKVRAQIVEEIQSGKISTKDNFIDAVVRASESRPKKEEK